jgi:glycosyltransferase involved in cell wall biosynthesis
MLTASVIIATYNRPDEVTDCIRSILIQTEKPVELIVVDDGDLPGVPLEAECTAAGINCKFHKKDTPGTTESRNAGVKLATGDIIIFFDDDTELEPDYIKEIMNVFRDDTKGTVGGVCGDLANPRALRTRDYIKGLFEWFFLLHGYREGRILPSGFCVDIGETPFPLKKICDVDFVAGYGMAYRKEVFKDLSFTKKYRAVSFGEDKDFSASVARKYRQVYTPKARIVHHFSKLMRPVNERWEQMRILGVYIFFKKHVKRSPFSWVFFWYAISGYLILRLLGLIIFPSSRKYLQLKGALGAIWDILSGNAPFVDSNR